MSISIISIYFIANLLPSEVCFSLFITFFFADDQTFSKITPNFQHPGPISHDICFSRLLFNIILLTLTFAQILVQQLCITVVF